MLTLDRLVRRRRALVVALWALALAAAIPFAARQSDHLTGGGFEAAGSQSQRVERAVGRRFSGLAPETLAAVLVARPGARADDWRRAAADVRRELSRAGVGVGAGTRGHGAVVLALALPSRRQSTIDAAKRLRPLLGIAGGRPGSAAGGRVEVHLTGQGALWAAFQAASKKDVAAAETRGFPVIAIVLLAAFGSLAAVALPLGLGIAAVTITGALIYALSLATQMSVFVTNMASMLGIGVAVDYSLFVLARYREEVAAGRDHEQARATALATSGVAVLFSGLTVIASLAGLFLLGSTALSSLAIGAIIVVAVSMLAAATLLPALIALLGRRAHERGRLGRALERRRGTGPGLWPRWTAAVMRRPVRSLVGGTAILLALAIPALSLHMENSAIRQLPAHDEARDGVRAAAAAAGPGAAGPALVLVDFGRGRVDPRSLARTAAAVRRDPAVARVALAGRSRDGHSALLSATFHADPESGVARAAVTRLRHELRPPGATVAVGGTTATILDFDDLVAGSIWKLMLFVLALSFVVLLVLLRSLVLPLKAVLMNVLSVAAAYGVLVAIFQWGWLGFLGLEKAPFVDTITPPLVLAIAFGLSMDYEVFLLTRIRERYAATGDNRRAVAEGLATSAHTITSAALIMVAVFVAFVSAGLPSVQRLGVAAAAAIALDATIVRLVIVPAAMELLGRWNWWLPRPLARILPKVDVERLGAARARDAALETAA